MTVVDDNHSTKFAALATWMDAEARRYACETVGIAAAGSPFEQVERLREALEGDSERLLAVLRPEDLVAILRTWGFRWGDRRTHLLGVRGASLDELQVATRRIAIQGWVPRRRAQPDVPGTVLRLCWYDVGAAHAGEFDDDDGPDEPDGDSNDELADEAIYTIIAPESLDGHERTGVRFEEGRPWVAGARFFEEAQREGRRLVVVFADAKSTGRLVGWTFVRSLTVTSSTVCETGPIVRLRRARTDSIRKLSDSQPLADEYIRPYVPCQCPSFVRRTVDRMRVLLGDTTLAVAPAEPVPSVEVGRPAPRPAPTTPRPASVPTRDTVPAAADHPLLAFSWGYEGWGNHTAELVKMVDAVEASRGFGPPLFVDVRLKRVVRAIGFRERAFEKLLGERYVWLQGLGNVAVGDHSLAMALSDPSQLETLLDLVAQRAAADSRVIFFCSCGSPLARSRCHRGMVTDALLAVARKRGIPLAVQEWPGGSPMVTDLEIPIEHMRRLRVLGNSEDGGSMRVPVSANISVARAAALPHYSLIRCRAGDAEAIAASGPAILTPQGWMFPVHEAWCDVEIHALQEEVDEDLTTSMLLPFGAPLMLPPRWRVETLNGTRSRR